MESSSSGIPPIKDPTPIDPEEFLQGFKQQRDYNIAPSSAPTMELISFSRHGTPSQSRSGGG
eukprot:4479647-Prorocentrum_lima.AAC.1